MHNIFMADVYRKRRVVIVFISLLIFVFILIQNSPIQNNTTLPIRVDVADKNSVLAIDALKTLEIKGRAPKTDYSRDKFGNGWQSVTGCDMRNIILNRDLEKTIVDNKCNVTNGKLNDPYTSKIIEFTRGSDTSGAVQIDHVVALSDAWQKGAQLLSSEKRIQLANDPLELLAVDGNANQEKSDSDAASWLPANKSFRCQYVARQIAVKQKYSLWVTEAEYDIMTTILSRCEGQILPIP
jgi:hypothetical protein